MQHRRLRNLFLCFLFATTLVGAKTLQFGFISVVDDPPSRSFPQVLFAMVSEYAQTVATSAHYDDLFTYRTLQETQRTFLEEQHRTIKNLDGVVPRTKFAPPSLPINDETPFDIVWQQITVATGLSHAIAENNATVIDYVLALHNLDYLFVCSVTDFDAFYRVQMTTYNRLQQEGVVLYDGLTLPEELSKLQGAVFLASIGALSGKPLGLIDVLDPVPGLALSADGQELVLYDGFLPLPAGEHLLVSTTQGFQPLEQQVLIPPGGIIALEFSMEPIAGPPLLVTSFTHTPLVTITQGPKGTLPLIWPSQQNPFALYAHQEGLKPVIRQYNKSIEQIELTLQPPWMNSAGVVARSQTDLYASLGRTLLLSATAIVLDALSRSLSTTFYWQPLVWGAIGTVALSSIETGAQLFAYYQKTKYSSQ